MEGIVTMDAAAYARFSTDRQNENSIDTQLAAIADYCQKHDIAIVSTFVDMAMIGTNTERSDFQRILEALSICDRKLGWRYAPADSQAACEKIYAHVDDSFTVHVGVHINGCGERI